jgi:hypothetical protein
MVMQRVPLYEAFYQGCSIGSRWQMPLDTKAQSSGLFCDDEYGATKIRYACFAAGRSVFPLIKRTLVDQPSDSAQGFFGDLLPQSQ